MCLHYLVIAVDVEIDFDTLKREYRQGILFRGLIFQIVVFHFSIAEQKIKKFISGRYRGGKLSIQSLNRGEIWRRHRVLTATSAASTTTLRDWSRRRGLSAGRVASALSAAAWSRKGLTYAGDSAHLICCIARAPANSSSRCRGIKSLWPLTEEYDYLALNILTLIIVDIILRNVQTISHEFDLIRGKGSFST